MEFDRDNPLTSASTRESAKALKALSDYARMGIGRSLRKLIERYQQDTADWTIYKANKAGWPKDKPIPTEAPTTRWMTITGWSSQFSWVERVKRYDELEREQELKEFEADRILMRRQRINMLKRVFVKSSAALGRFVPEADKEPTQLVPSELREWLKFVIQELRKELGDEKPSITFEIDYNDPTIPISVLEMIANGTATEADIRSALRASKSSSGDTD